MALPGTSEKKAGAESDGGVPTGTGGTNVGRGQPKRLHLRACPGAH